MIIIYKTICSDNDLILILPDFSLAQTLDCGQCFRWEELPGGGFKGVVGDKVLTLCQDGDRITFKDTDTETFNRIWRRYFDLDTDYTAVKQLLCRDDILRSACEYAGGIRILRQEPWETLCTFIISQNNNIPRIKGIVSRLCAAYGEPLADGLYSFPSAERIAALPLDGLDLLRAGFRAKYIRDAAQKIAGGAVDLTKIETLPIDEARQSLMTICGVGPKVAECALLFGFHRVEAFPIDVWIKRALEYYYKDGFPEFAVPYGGIAQQYIFHYIRTCETAIPPEYKRK